MGERHTTRRTFLSAAGGATLAAACAPSASVPATQPPASRAEWEAEWDRVTQAAKQEGKVVVHTLVGEGYRKTMDAFEAAFPGISVEHTALFARDWAPRVVQERKAGLYAWDLTMSPAITAFGTLWPEKVFDPIRPLLFRPDVLADQWWKGGFDFGFADNEKQYAFGFTWNLQGALYLNTDLTKDEVKSFKDILNPKWKGQIAIADPRTGGASATPLAVAALKNGDDAVRRLFREQEPVLFSEPRQGAEHVVRGRVAICIGTTEAVMNDFRAEGLAKNVKILYVDDVSYLQQEVLWFMNRAPNPNAAKLFANWLLSKEGQEAYAKRLDTNSRRADVAVVDQNSYPPEGAAGSYLDMLRQDKYPETERVREITRELLK